MNTILTRDYGATGDGVMLDTRAIQAAIDACINMGAGQVCTLVEGASGEAIIKA